MLSTLLSIYSALVLNSTIPTFTPHIIPWDENILLTTQLPIKNEKNISPIIDAKSAIAVDLDTGLILYEKNAQKKLPIASLTKLMTTSIILEENDINKTIKVDKLATKINGSKIWLVPNEKITIKNLLRASLINSANDAATALAKYNGKTIKHFVEKMNEKSKELKLYSTHFVNPTGLEDMNYLTDKPLKNEEKTLENTQNLSSAYDLAILSRYAYGKSFIRNTVNKKELEISSKTGTTTYKLKNTNKLLDSYLNVLGLKTGTTDSAGQCLIAIIENKNHHKILTVVLNSPNRFKETKILADWVFRTYKWQS